MGIFDLLSKEGRAKSALDRHIKRVNERYMAHAERIGSMERLIEIGSDEALFGLLKRFGFVSEGKVMMGELSDEGEKEWAVDALVSLGDKTMAPLRRYLFEGESIAYPLRILERIAPPEGVLKVLDELIEREEPGYTRHPQRKVQFLTWLGEWKAVPPVEAARRIVPYLKDFDENVRFTAAEELFHQKDEATARGPLLDALIRPEEESRRIRVRVAELLVDTGWRVDDSPEHKQGVVKLLASDLPEFGLNHEKIVRKGK